MPPQNTPAPPPSHLGGEEWRDIDIAPGHYHPADHDQVLRQARAGIREHRMGQVTLRMVDAQGRPHAGVKLQIEQTGSAFPVGDQLWALDRTARNGQWEGEWARAFRWRFSELFNAANNLCYWTERPRNDGSKTEAQQGDWRLDNFARTVEWTRDAGMLAKGHPLFWSIPKCVPDWVKRYDHETRMKFAEVRVRNIVARFKGKVTIWDAVNEPMWEAALKNLDQRQWPHIEPIKDVADDIEAVLRWCKEEDPGATFLVNDYGMIATDDKELKGHDGSKVTASSQRRRYVALFQELASRGTPPDGVGLQGHTGWVPHDLQWHVLSQMHEGAGLPVHITEFWAKTDELRKAGTMPEHEIDARHAEYVANFLTVAFGHPGVASFFFWGLMGEAIKWQPDGGHDLRPTYKRVKQLLHEEWRTREAVTTDREGVATFRGFFGSYEAMILRDNGYRTALRFTHDRQHAGPITLTYRVGK